MDQNYGARLRRDGSAETLRVYLPAMVVNQRRITHPNVVKNGKVIEERVAGLWDHNFCSRIAEQPEQKAVGLTRTCRQDDLCWIEQGSVIFVVGANGPAGGELAARLRIVIESLRTRERVNQIGRKSEVRTASDSRRSGRRWAGQPPGAADARAPGRSLRYSIQSAMKNA